MKEKTVGKIKNVAYDMKSGDLEFTIRVTDLKFKKKLLRDLALSGNIKLKGNEIIYIDPDEVRDAGI